MDYERHPAVFCWTIITITQYENISKIFNTNNIDEQILKYHFFKKLK